MERKNRLYIVLIVLLLLAIAAVVFFYAGKNDEPAEIPIVTAQPTQQVIIKEKEVEKIVEVQKEISSEIIQDGLNDMGLLITEEYYFTDVVSFSSIKSFLNINLGITESSYLASYDGVVTAGIDFSKISVRKDEDKATIFIDLPKSDILNVDIDPNSFQLYSEKSGLGNHVSAEDFNNSLIELENTAKAKALERGLLERADENAQKLIKNFVSGLIDTDYYSVKFTTAE